jgi:hypothetical protein
MTDNAVWGACIWGGQRTRYVRFRQQRCTLAWFNCAEQSHWANKAKSMSVDKQMISSTAQQLSHLRQLALEPTCCRTRTPTRLPTDSLARALTTRAQLRTRADRRLLAQRSPSRRSRAAAPAAELHACNTSIARDASQLPSIHPPRLLTYTAGHLTPEECQLSNFILLLHHETTGRHT